MVAFKLALQNHLLEEIRGGYRFVIFERAQREVRESEKSLFFTRGLTTCAHSTKYSLLVNVSTPRIAVTIFSLSI